MSYMVAWLHGLPRAHLSTAIGVRPTAASVPHVTYVTMQLM
jgi:hypothetical protein